MHFNKASDRVLSCANRSAVRPAPYSRASRAASSMWSKRVRSLGGILDGRTPHHFIAKISAKLCRRAKIHLTPPENSRKLAFHTCQPQITDPLIRVKLHEHVDVARVIETVAQDGSEQCQLAYAIAPAKLCKLILCDFHVCDSHPKTIMADPNRLLPLNMRHVRAERRRE